MAFTREGRSRSQAPPGAQFTSAAEMLRGRQLTDRPQLAHAQFPQQQPLDAGVAELTRCMQSLTHCMEDLKLNARVPNKAEFKDLPDELEKLLVDHEGLLESCLDKKLRAARRVSEGEQLVKRKKLFGET